MNEDSPLISIIILNWDGLKYLQQDLPSILALNYPNFEVIIVDNGSTDESCEFIKALKGNYQNLKLIRNETNLGYSKGRNIGVANSKGEYILFLDNDIDISSNKNILQELLQAYKDVDNPAFLLVPLIDKEDLDEMKTRRYGAFYTFYGIKRNKYKTYEDIKKLCSPTGKISSCFGGDMFLSRKVWDDLGGFDESQTFNIDDDDIGTRASVFGYQNYLYGQQYFVHIGEERRRDNKMYANYFKLSYSGKARALVKNMQFSTLLYMLPMYTLFSLGVAVKQSVQRLYPCVFFAFVSSFVRFIKWLPDTLKQRKIVQGRRKVSDKEFLKLSF